MVLRRFLLLVLVAFALVVRGQSVFDMPRLFPQHVRYLAQFVAAVQKGDLFGAETAARAGAQTFPRDANWHYNVACICAKGGRSEEALEWLEKAIERGFSDVAQLKGDEDLASVRQLPAFEGLVARAEGLAGAAQRNPTLSQAVLRRVPLGGEAVVDAEDTQWEWDPAQGGYMTTCVRLEPAARHFDAAAYRGPWREAVRAMMSPEACSGLLYVNRDEDMAVVDFAAFPGLTPVVYGAEAQAARAHIGVANGLFSTGLATYPVIGNSAFARGHSIFWRSIGREIATEPAAMALAYRLAAANQCYVYDVTADYSPAWQGDVLLGANPAIFLSRANALQPDHKLAQRHLVELLLAGFAVTPPEARREMVRRGLLVATFQRALRSHLRIGADYLSGGAHPVAFGVGDVDEEAFLRAMHALTPATLPPAIQLRVRQESMPVQFVDYFDLVESERGAESPVSIMRVMRGRGYTRRLTVQAEASQRGCRFHWFPVSADAKRLRIRPLAADGALVTIEADYVGERPGAEMPTPRVEVACVAETAEGVFSAPAFVTFRYLRNERRHYSEEGRLLSIDYRAPEGGFRYEDPALTAFKNWQDVYRYEGSRCVGWQRRHGDGVTQDFDARGRRILARHPNGSPAKVQPVSYVPRVNQGADGLTAPALELIQVDVGAPIDIAP